MTAVSPSVHTDPATGGLPGLAAAEALCAAHLDDAVRAFGQVALQAIELGPLSSSQLVPAQIRAFGALYWCSELERAGLVPFLEGVADAIVRGTIIEPMGDAVQSLVSFWRHREFHFRRPEREALFQRMFDEGTGDSAFLPAFRRVVDGLSAIGRAGTTESLEPLVVRAAVQARDLGTIAASRGTGIAAFAARDIIGQIRVAWDLLRRPDLSRVLQGGSPWMLLERHGRRFTGRELSPRRPLDRANAGVAIVRWIADEAPRIESGAVRLARTSPVVQAALAWSAASDRG